MELTMLGTGNAEALRCYNSCCLIENGGDHFLVDAGGGNGILLQLEKAGVAWEDIKHIFITHRHIDHSLGVFWLIRHILAGVKDGSYEGSCTIYGHHEVLEIIQRAVPVFFSTKHQQRMDGRIHLHELEDGETIEIIGRPVTFFDVGADKVRQYGFSMELPDGGRLVSCGDEPARPAAEPYTRGAKYLMHEAFCLEDEGWLAARRGKYHSTVEEAAARAADLGAENLILHHTQDNLRGRRKDMYRQAAGKHFAGTIYVPDDLDRIALV